MSNPVSSATRSLGRRGRPTATESRQRMTDLLHVARAEFMERGYRQTTMDHIAEAAGVTKRTLYSWHEDKAALFRACLKVGAARFPTIDPDAADAQAELLRYLTALVVELARERNLGIGRLFLRESGDFPEMSPMVERSYADAIIDPLAAFLRAHGLERPGSVERAELLGAMALAPIHNSLLLGRAVPERPALEAHVRFVTPFFLAGARA